MRRALLVVALVTVCYVPGSALASPPQVHAAAYMVQDARTGDVLASYRAHTHLPIASITKLMTVLVALQHLKPDDVVTVTSGAAQVGESRIPLHTGERISVHDLLEGALIQSANNAADALAAAAANGDVTTFVGWMNERARQLGLRDTHFVRPDGLDTPGHVSSARDVALLARVAMRSPVVRDIVRKRSDVIEDGRVPVRTWNDLLGFFPGLVGVKTGHTDNAGWCEVAAVQRPGYMLYAVVLGVPSRAQRNDDLWQLLAWGVDQYRSVFVIRERIYAWARLPYGQDPLPLEVTTPTLRVVRRGVPLVERIVAPSAVALPVHRGDRLGRVEVWRGRKLVAAEPLEARYTVEKPGAFGRFSFYVARTVHHVAGLFH